MKVRILFNDDGHSVNISGGDSIKDGQDVYDVDQSPTGKYVKEVDGSVRPMTKEEAYAIMPNEKKIIAERDSISDIIDDLLESVSMNQDLTDLFAGTPFAGRIERQKALREKYKK